MKGLLLSLVVVAGTAQATGMKREVYVCGGGAGEFAAAFRVTHFSTSAPGGPVNEWYEASASHSWLGGTHHSGAVRVKTIFAADGGPQHYFNKKAGFELTVERTAGVNAQGRPRRAFVRARFVDPKTKMKGQITPRWLNCR